MAASYLEQKAKLETTFARKKKRVLRTAIVAGILLALPAVFFAFLDMNSLDPGVTIHNFRRLRIGMSEAEIEALLESRGIPLEDAWDGWLPSGPNLRKSIRPGDRKVWHGKQLNIYIAFDHHDRADSFKMVWHGPGHPPTPFLEKVRKWVGLDKP